MTTLTKHIKVPYFEISPVSDGGLCCERRIATFSTMHSAIEFAKKCYNSEGDLAVNTDWIETLPRDVQEYITGDCIRK